jgi:hypothetical protein
MHNLKIFGKSAKTNLDTLLFCRNLVCRKLLQISECGPRFPGFGGPRRPAAAPARAPFQSGGGGGGCTPTANYQSGGRNFWVSWRTCGTQFRGDQVWEFSWKSFLHPNPPITKVRGFFRTLLEQLVSTLNWVPLRCFFTTGHSLERSFGNLLL